MGHDMAVLLHMDCHTQISEKSAPFGIVEPGQLRRQFRSHFLQGASYLDLVLQIGKLAVKFSCPFGRPLDLRLVLNFQASVDFVIQPVYPLDTGVSMATLQLYEAI